MSDHLGRPIEGPLGNALFGSDIVAETLRALDIPDIALNPGASYRGLHDSIVNYLGNKAPQMLLCPHEETFQCWIIPCDDGDFMMGVTALWTAVHYRIQLLLVVANNRSFFNDELHQERVARVRSRPVENKWIGQRIDDPAIDMAKLAEGEGAAGFGPVEDAASLVDVRVTPGYAAVTTAAPMGTGRG